MRSDMVSTAVVAAVLLAPFTSSARAQARQAVDRADQLPAHTYAVAKAPSTMLRDTAALAPLLDSLRADLEADLKTYDIRDGAELRSYYRSLGRIALLQHRPDDALAYEGKARALEEKPAQRIMSGVRLNPLVAAERAGSARAADAYAVALKAELARLPFDSVRVELNLERARMGNISAALLEGRVANNIDPAARAGRVSKQVALQIVNNSFVEQRELPFKAEAIRQLSALIDAHHVDVPSKADIWAARDVSLEAHAGLTPVVVAISDGGVDPSVFAGRMWTNAREVPGNGKDDDGNGFVDDVHGIAWAADGRPLTGDLRPIALSAAEIAQLKQRIRGSMDLQAGIDSRDAQDMRRYLASLSPEQGRSFFQSLRSYSSYAHGTHVAGIAARGNPAVRLQVMRFESPDDEVPSPANAWVPGFAHALERTVAYYRATGVRVVNMSWGFSVRFFEQSLERNGAVASQEERHRLAAQAYDTLKRVFGAAIAGAPDILFVSGAGNWDESNQFNEFIPAAYDFPNTMTVGAVDAAGDEARFTSFGKVDVYANGYQVESFVPGGGIERMTGTSMASPQVVNLAAKLFALYPKLDAVTVKRLIIEGADTKDVSNGRTIRLLNEKRSVDMADRIRR